MITNTNGNFDTTLSFNAKKKLLDKPIENVQTVIENGVDTLITIPNETENKKKIKKRAIAASSSVLVLGSLTLLLNPKNTGKTNKYIKNLLEKIKSKTKQNNENTLKNRLYKFGEKTLSGVEKCGNVYFNFNSFKDWAWDDLCTNSNKKYPEFLTKHKTTHKIVKTADNFWVKITKKPNEAITKWFDNISKKTVKNKYKNALKELDSLEIALKAHKDKLSADKQTLIENKLKEIAKVKEAFNEENVLIRLKKQENMMSNLKEDFAKRLYNKKDGWCKNKTSFWARDILIPQKTLVEKEGNAIVEKLFGNENKKGLYNEAADILRNNLDEKQFKALQKDLDNASKKIKKANLSECTEYFDKKRDLILGGAPTDIITQLFGLGMCGWAVTKADKEDRWSKLMTTGIPVITGLGSSLYFSAKLFSGAKSIIYGAIVSGLTTIGCNLIDKHILGNEDRDEEKDSSSLNNNKNLEVQNA